MHAAGLWLLLLLSLFSIPGKEGVPFGEDAKDASSRGKDEVDATALLQKIMGTTLGTTSGLQDYNPKDWPTPEQYLAAAGWHVRDEIKRLPVIFIPPFSGTRILQKIQDRPVKSPMDFFCERSSEGKWKNLWLPTKDEVGLLSVHCLIENMAFWGKDPSRADNAYPNPDGVETGVDEAYGAGMYLDKEGTAPIYGVWSKALEQMGWRPGFDMDVLRYDWRKGPDDYMRPNGSFDVLKQMVEETVEVTGKKVVVVSMSMGGPLFALFCSKHVDEAWKAAHIDSFFSLSGSFGGTTSPLFSILTGKWGKVVPWYLEGTVNKLARSMGSPPWMCPSEDTYGPDRVVIKTPSRQYTTSQIGQALVDAGAIRSSTFWSAFRSMNGAGNIAPNVTTYCLYGVSVPTPDSIIMTSGELGGPNAKAEFSYADGDGTVMEPGLAACQAFEKYQDFPVRTFRFPGVPHTEMLKNLDAFRLVAHRLGQPEGRGRHERLFDMLGHH